MADQGQSFNDLISSLSGLGSTSGNLADLALTGQDNQVRPLTDYDSFANHVFFGNAVERFRKSLRYIEDKYPIGSPSATDQSSLCAENVYQVDKWKKEAKGFDLWLLDQLSATGTITAAATNQNGEQVALDLVRRSGINVTTGSQTATIDSISAEAHLFEDEQIGVVNVTSGSSNDHNIWGSTAEVQASRGPNLANQLPLILFDGDDNEILESLMRAFGDQLDELKQYIDQISYVKHISYDDVNRSPNKFLPVLAKQFGIDLHQSAAKSPVENFLVKSASGLTTQEITYAIWNRIINNAMLLLKKKGTRPSAETVGKIYGVDHNFLRTDEYTLFNSPKQIREREEVDVPVFFTTGDAYAQMPTGSISAWDYTSSANFTIEARVSATGALNQKLIVHPLYTLELNRNGQAVFSTTAGTSVSTEIGSISSWIQTKDKFTNVVASRNADDLNVWVLSMTGTGSGSEDHVVLASGTTAGLRDESFDSSAGASSFGTYFPGSGSFSGYIHEVRVWDVALDEADLKEHTRNFQSISFIHSTASNSATYGSLQAHYKLKENVVLTGDYNYIVDSTTGTNTANAVNFSNQTTKRYRVFTNEPKVVKWYPSGLAVDNDKVRQTTEDTRDIEDQGYVSVHMTPVHAINRDIRNVIEDLNIIELLGDPEDLFKFSYTGPIQDRWKDITSRYGTNDLADFNTFIKAVGGFNDVMGSIYPFLRQFLPAKTNILSEGVLIENHILERLKNKRERYSTTIMSPTGFGIATHERASDTGSASAATTADFQGYRYAGLQDTITNGITAEKVIVDAATNVPRYSGARTGRFLPVKVTPSRPNETAIEVTMSRLDISPTASPSAFNGYVDGKLRMLRNGKAFKTDVPAIRIEFPSSADGTNFFSAEVGDIDNGKGRVISGKELTFVTKIDLSEIQIKLQLDSVVRSLSADDTSLSGTVGIVPIRFTNLFSNSTQIVRLAIGNDNALVQQLAGQGGVTINS